MVFTDNQSFCICCYKLRAKRLVRREFISFKLRVSPPFTFESQNNAVFFFWDRNITSVTMNSSAYKINNNRVLKCDVIKNQICEIMGFASIF